MLPSNNEPDTEGLSLWVTMFVVQTPVSERTDTLIRLVSMLHILLGSATQHCPWQSGLRKSGVALCAKDLTHDHQLAYGTVMRFVPYANEGEQFLQ
jgi:hypothetical protein